MDEKNSWRKGLPKMKEMLIPKTVIQKHEEEII